MTPDGSVIISTEVNTNGISKGVTDIKSQFGKLGGAIKKLGITTAVAFVTRKLVQFGKEALELGSDLQEVQNVVDVTFTTMSEQINEFAKNAMFTAGLSETMAKKYTGTFGAMAKSFKFTEAEAYEMSTSLTQLAGDVASFYNLTQDAAYTKLKSVFTGETESLKDLGVVMTQTALDSYALANGFGKTTAQMTEQEKVALRYQFVMEQLSDASGDFIRTSDSWANQTKILSLQFESLKATIGQGLINALTPVIKVINTILYGFRALANSFKQLTALLFGDASASSSAEEALEEMAEGYDAVAESAAGAGKAADGYLSGLDEISKLSDSGGSGSGAAGGAGGIITPENSTGEDEDEDEEDLSPTLQALVDKIKDLLEPLQKIDFTSARKALKKLGDSFKKLGDTLGAALEWAWENILVPLAEWTVEEFAPTYVEYLAAAFDLLNDVLIALQPFGMWLWENFLQPMGQWAGNVIIGALETLTGLFRKLGDWIRENAVDIWGKVQETWKAVSGWFETNVSKPLSDIAVKIDKAITDAFIGAKTAVTNAWSTVKTWFSNNVATPVKDAFTGVKTWISNAFTNAKTAVINAWQTVKTWFTTTVIEPLQKGFSNAKRNISQAFTDAKTAVTTAWSTVSKWFTDNIATPVGTVFTSIKTAITDAFSTAKTAVETAWGTVSTWFQTNVVDPVKSMFQTIWDTLTGLFSGDITFTDLVAAIGNVFKEFINDLIEGMNALLSKVVEPMNTMITKLKGMNLFGSYPFSFLTTLTAPQIPYLAKGAVIPPNAPFMAVLGDQKRGTNIEAPLETIKQAVAEVVGNGKGNTYHVTVNCEQRKLLEIIIDEAELWQGQTGSNPFELAY